VKLNYLFTPAPAYGALTLLIILALLCILPFHYFYLRSRIELFRVLCHIVASPFGIVKFKHFFLADIITSMVNPLRDLGAIVALFVSGNWLEMDKHTA
jgi:hypothetical protein